MAADPAVRPPRCRIRPLVGAGVAFAACALLPAFSEARIRTVARTARARADARTAAGRATQRLDWWKRERPAAARSCHRRARTVNARLRSVPRVLARAAA